MLDVTDGARNLVGCHLVRGELRARLVEVEAYGGADDPGSHAFRGRTPRNGTMFGPPGHAYIYFNYGIHWMLNVSARPEGEPAAILIRAAEPLTGLEEMRSRRRTTDDRALLSGPGKLTQAFGVDRTFEGINLLDATTELRIEPGEPTEVLVDRRIGLAIGKGELTEWRFLAVGADQWWSRRIVKR